MKNLLRIAPVAVFVLLVGLVGLTNLFSNKSINKDDLPLASAEKTICQLIPWDTLDVKFKSASSKELFLEIYPTKYSGKTTQNDFELVTIFRNSKGKVIGHKKISEMDLDKRSKLYLNHFKPLKGSQGKVSQAFKMKLSGESLMKQKCVVLCLDLATGELHYSYQCAKDKKPVHELVASDSAVGKCPPCKYSL